MRKAARISLESPAHNIKNSPHSNKNRKTTKKVSIEPQIKNSPEKITQIHNKNYKNNHQNNQNYCMEDKNKITKAKYYNPYKQIYENDLKHWQKYQQSTGKYENNGINLKLPFYFQEYHQQ